ncbi:hypothetical protein [Mangrovicella endophytica]|uniref:hypothetical protein n=1 Tax=Mangrovicella endophytica TaxID=2066697 RepID=UPI000C9DFC88|nr:hypothetical protein [Mangrovicella endophytica]
MTVRVPSDEDAEALDAAPGDVVVVVCPSTVLDVDTLPFPAVTVDEVPLPTVVLPETTPLPAVTELDVRPESIRAMRLGLRSRSLRLTI